MRQVTVNTPSGHYAVVIGRGALARVGAMVSGLAENTGVFLLSSPRVWQHWGAKLEGSFAKFGGSKKVLFDDSERAKRLATVEKLCRALARAGADRGAVLVALGGGVVGDVVGFTAAVYMRGVRVVQVPTTLVAQVDAAIGGKTGVNLPEGKNLVGAFHQPRLVVCDPATLKTLPAREFRSGLYEVIKYGVICHARLFDFLERHLDQILAHRPTPMGWMLACSVRAKAAVVRRDERETTGERRILNFGHTIGHALEALTGYKRFLHGEAVAWGMLAAAEIAAEHGRLSREDRSRIAHLILRVGPLPALPKLSTRKLLAALRMDKKTRGGKLHFVLPTRIGAAEVRDDIPEKLLPEILRRLYNLHTQEQ
jgi:3-dehydroquinate synthase